MGIRTPLISTLPLSAAGSGLKPVFVLSGPFVMAAGEVAMGNVDASVASAASVAAKAGKLKQAVSSNVAFKVIVLSLLLYLWHYC